VDAEKQIRAGDDGRWLVKRVALGMVFGLLVAGLVLSPLGRTMSGQVITAVLAFVGALVTFTATVIGFSVQHQAQVKQNRQFELDAAMRAGRLIAPEDGSSAGPSALASGLVALTNLNQAELAVSLLVDLWSVRVDDDGTRQDNSQCQVASEIAILVINGALAADCRNAQLMAAELLCRNATRLTATQSLHWPAVIDGRWRPEFGKRTKLLLVEALVNMTTCPGKPANEGTLRSVAVRLYGVSRDPEERVKACVGKLIKALVPALERCKSKEFTQGGEIVKLEQLIRAADYPPDNPDGYLSDLSDRLAARLGEWAEGATGIPSDPGCLATAG
jgi:hypothetical protein